MQGYENGAVYYEVISMPVRKKLERLLLEIQLGMGGDRGYVDLTRTKISVGNGLKHPVPFEQTHSCHVLKN